VKQFDLMALVLDRTLVRSGEYPAAAASHTLQLLALSSIVPDQRRRFAGGDLKVAIRNTLGLNAGEYVDRNIPLPHLLFRGPNRSDGVACLKDSSQTC
jgi:hypothetical protein